MLLIKNTKYCVYVTVLIVLRRVLQHVIRNRRLYCRKK